MKKALLSIFALALVVPMVSSAQSLFGGFTSYIQAILSFINSLLIPAIFTLAFLVFVWGVFKAFILGGHEEEKRKEGRNLIIYSIVGFVIMLSVWGIVNLVASSLGFQGDRLDPAAIPTFGPGGPTK